MAITKYDKTLSLLFLCCFAAACAPQGGKPDIQAEVPIQKPAQTKAPASIAMDAPVPANAARAMPREPFAIADDRGRRIEVYPPMATEPHDSFVVLLHATCMQPAWVCDWFGYAGRETGWLVCPSGNASCAGEPDWHGPGPEKAAFLESALQKVEASIPTFEKEQPGVLIGWSRGAFAARDILYASLDDARAAPLSKRFRGLVLMAASVKPDIDKLRRAGIARVVMAAGDFDGAKPTMVSAVAALRAGGMEARYVSLGKIPHVWPSDFEARMREPIAWAAMPAKSP